MIIASSLLMGFVTCMALGGWVLWTATRHATDGYEDGAGFHFGPLPLKIAPPPAVATPTSASVANAQTAAAPPAATGKNPDAISGPLYRRHRRSSNSRPPIPVASASPFEIQCAATRQRAGQTVGSTPPMDVSAKAIVKTILGQESMP